MTITPDQYRELRQLLLEIRCDLTRMELHMRRQDDAIKQLHTIVFETYGSAERKAALAVLDSRNFKPENITMPDDIAHLFDD